ncbi:MAG TPA: hypothetical protein VMH22_09115 [bacterium]|nr:hypothetical protein [bacterium]
MNSVKRTVFAIVIGLAMAASAQAGLLGDLGQVIDGSGGNIGQATLHRLQREAAYQVLRGILRGNGCRGADDYVSCIRALVENHDRGAATAAFLAGLERDGSDQARNILKVLYVAAVTIRLTNSEVADEVVSFVEYVNAREDFSRKTDDPQTDYRHRGSDAAPAAAVVAPQGNPTREVALRGSSELWDHAGSGGARTDMAPSFERPAGTRFTNSPPCRDENEPAPNVVRARSPEDRNPCQCPYTPGEQQPMSGAVYIGQSGLGGLLAPTTAGVMGQLSEASDARCNGQTD